jgi:hypothetical protein
MPPKIDIEQKVTDICCYFVTLIFIAAVIFAIIKETNNNSYIIAFMSVCVSHWLLDNIIKIIKKIGDKRGWFDE